MRVRRGAGSHGANHIIPSPNIMHQIYYVPHVINFTRIKYKDWGEVASAVVLIALRTAKIGWHFMLTRLVPLISRYEYL